MAHDKRSWKGYTLVCGHLLMWFCSAMFLFKMFVSQHLLDMSFYLKKFSQLVEIATPGQTRARTRMCSDPTETVP